MHSEYSHLDDVPVPVRRSIASNQVSPAPTHYSLVPNIPSPGPSNQEHIPVTQALATCNFVWQTQPRDNPGNAPHQSGKPALGVCPVAEVRLEPSALFSSCVISACKLSILLVWASCMSTSDDEV